MKKYVLVLVIIAAGAIPLLGSIVSDGALDVAFDAGTFTNGYITTAALQPDGKVLISGMFTKVHGVHRRSMARLQANGLLDETFDTGTADYGMRDILVQGDGRIIMTNAFTVGTGRFIDCGLVRLNADGTLDSSFAPARAIARTTMTNPDGTPRDPGFVYSALLQPDGKLIVVGSFSYIIAGGTAVPRSGVARFNSDGTFDSSFDPGAGIVNTTATFPSDTNASVVTLQRLGPDNVKLIIAGQFNRYDGNPVAGMVRVDVDGAYDSTFSAGGGAQTAPISDIRVQSDGRLIVSGSFTSFSDVPCTGLVRLLSSGEIDPSFAIPDLRNYGLPASVDDVQVQPDDKLVVTGFFHSLNGAPAHNVARLEANGAQDLTFDSSIAAGPSAFRVTVVLLDSAGKMFVGGHFSSYGGAVRHNLAWLHSDGSVDPRFEALPGVTEKDPQIFGVAVQLDGKIIVGGLFSSLKGVPHNNIVRLNEDFTVDPSFHLPEGTEGSLRAVLLQPDGKILIAGHLRAVSGITRGRIARLLPDGSLDSSFDPGTGADNAIFALAQDADGNTYVGGSFQKFDGAPRLGVAKLSPTGALDPTFNADGGGTNSIVYAIAPPDAAGRIVIAGAFSSYNNAAVGRIARLNASTGARDEQFTTGIGFDNVVRALLRDADGKYYAGGSFGRFNGVSRPSVARLHSDGTLDLSFSNTNSIPVTSLALRNGKVYIGGASRYVNPLARPLRLTSSGSIDQTFSPGGGIAVVPANNYYHTGFGYPDASALAFEQSGKLLVGGFFNQYDGHPRVGLIRLTDSSLIFTAVSRKAHGAAGTFDVSLPLAGPPGVEPRTGGADGTHQLVLNFAGAVSVKGAAITSGSGSVAGLSGSGTPTITLDLSGVANSQRITVTLHDVSTATSTTDIDVQVAFLVGDTNGSGSVNASDVSQTKASSGQPVNASTFRFDVNANGAINSSDVALVKSASGTSLPVARDEKQTARAR